MWLTTSYYGTECLCALSVSARARFPRFVCHCCPGLFSRCRDKSDAMPSRSMAFANGLNNARTATRSGDVVGESGREHALRGLSVYGRTHLEVLPLPNYRCHCCHLNTAPASLVAMLFSGMYVRQGLHLTARVHLQSLDGLCGLCRVARVIERLDLAPLHAELNSGSLLQQHMSMAGW